MIGDLKTMARRIGMERRVLRSERIELKLFRMCCHLKKFACAWQREGKVGRKKNEISK